MSQVLAVFLLVANVSYEWSLEINRFFPMKFCFLFYFFFTNNDNNWRHFRSGISRVKNCFSSKLPPPQQRKPIRGLKMASSSRRLCLALLFTIATVRAGVLPPDEKGAAGSNLGNHVPTAEVSFHYNSSALVCLAWKLEIFLILFPLTLFLAHIP